MELTYCLTASLMEVDRFLLASPVMMSSTLARRLARSSPALPANTWISQGMALPSSTPTRHVCIPGHHESPGNVLTTFATVGVNSVVPIPVTFSGQVYLDFTADCRILAVRAYAEIPTYINGKPVTIYELLPIPTLPL